MAPGAGRPHPGFGSRTQRPIPGIGALVIRRVVFDLGGTLVQAERLTALSCARSAVELCSDGPRESEVAGAFLIEQALVASQSRPPRQVHPAQRSTRTRSLD